MQQGDFGSVSYYQYPQNPLLHNNFPNSNSIPNPNLVDHHPNPLPPTYASAPPFSPNYPSSEYSSYPSNHAPYPQNSDPVATVSPTNSSYSSGGPSLQAFNPSPQQTSFPSYAPVPADASGQYMTPTQQQSYVPPFDHRQPASHFAPAPQMPSIPPNPISKPSPILPSYGLPGASIPPVYENSYENSLKFDYGGGYSDEISSRYGGYGRTRSDLGSEFPVKRYDVGEARYNSTSSLHEGSLGDGVYAYDGGKVQPYGARGTSSKLSNRFLFDDYGRSVNAPSQKDQTSSPKVMRAIPKVEPEHDARCGVQKFRVKLLPEGGGQNAMDVLCQIGLDGIFMLDPSSGRTLRIYSLDTVTRCDVTESSTFTFWAKSSVDFEPRRIRLQSTSYTTNTLLDTVTAAMAQLKEMGGRMRPTDSMKADEQPADKRKGFGDWMNVLKPANEEKDHWVPDEAILKCTACGSDFGAFVRRHHCRNCGDIFCNKCTNGRIALTADENAQAVRVCDRCMAEVTQRLSNAKETGSKPAGLRSHEDLAKKLQEELEKNRKASGSGPDSDGSNGRRMREVACPTCTVHLQVQVPSSGSETIECGVCQQPFLVGAH